LKVRLIQNGFFALFSHDQQCLHYTQSTVQYVYSQIWTDYKLFRHF